MTSRRGFLGSVVLSSLVVVGLGTAPLVKEQAEIGIKLTPLSVARMVSWEADGNIVTLDETDRKAFHPPIKASDYRDYCVMDLEVENRTGSNLLLSQFDLSTLIWQTTKLESPTGTAWKFRLNARHLHVDSLSYTIPLAAHDRKLVRINLGLITLVPADREDVPDVPAPERLKFTTGGGGREVSARPVEDGTVLPAVRRRALSASGNLRVTSRLFERAAK